MKNSCIIISILHRQVYLFDENIPFNWPTVWNTFYKFFCMYCKCLFIGFGKAFYPYQLSPPGESEGGSGGFCQCYHNW